MNLKDRLSNLKQTNSITIKDNLEFNHYDNISKFFKTSAIEDEIIISAIENLKNLIFLSDKSIDKSIIVYYFQSLFKDKAIELLNSIDDNIPYLNSKINLIANPSIKEVVKIFEYIIYGYKQFIFGLDMASDENLLEKLKSVILINYSNLTEKNIDTLLGFSNSIFISVGQDENGLLLVTKIQKLEYIDNNLSLNVIYTFEKDSEALGVEIPIDKLPEKIENITATDIKEDDETDVVSNNSEEEISTSEKNASVVLENEIIEETKKEEMVEVKESIDAIVEKEPLLKVNKYKLLKEKLKNKRNIG